MSGGPTNFFPGGAGNPVGFAAAPGFTSLGATTNLNAYALAQSGSVIPSGTPSNPTIVAFQDFDPDQISFQQVNYISSNGLIGGSAIHDVIFKGCRFQSNAAGLTSYNVDCVSNASYNITFSFCSFTPRTALVGGVTNPGSWPSASVGSGTTENGSSSSSPYMIRYQDGYFIGMAPGAQGTTKFLTIDHCDFWGGGQGGINFIGAANLAGQFNTPIIVSDCWVHDYRTPNPPVWNSGITYVQGDCVFSGASEIYMAKNIGGNLNENPSGGGNPTFWTSISNSGGDHTDGVGFVSGQNTPPTNVTMRHNTIASLGDNQAISLQVTGTDPYINWTIVNNYVSGFNNQSDIGSLAVGTNSSITYTDNIHATDLMWTNYPLLNNQGTMFTQSNGHNNIWRRNKVRLYPGSKTTYAATFVAGTGGAFGSTNEAFLLPDLTISATDWAL